MHCPERTEAVELSGVRKCVSCAAAELYDPEVRKCVAECAIQGLRSGFCGVLGVDGCAFVLKVGEKLECRATRGSDWLQVHGEAFLIEKTKCEGMVSEDGSECVYSCSPGVVSPADPKKCLSSCPDGFVQASGKCEECPLFWDRQTGACVDECRYVQRANRKICEDPEDAVFCATF